MTSSPAALPGRTDGGEAAALLALRHLPRCGDVTCLGLLRRFGSARAALRATLADRGVEAGEYTAWAQDQLSRAARLGVELVGFDDPRYPPLLRQIHDPPPILFVRGRAELLRQTAVAIVGSRRCSPYGAEVSSAFAGDLAGRGLAVVSGLARGIDAAAHEGALAAGATLAVLGCGADIPYPASNRALYDRILAEGAILSEVPLGSGPAAGSFPRRNRIISGMSLGVVVAEAPERSGALITARCAAEQGREVFAVPGEVTNRRCHGGLALLRDGACLARSADDVLEELWPRLPDHVRDARPGAASGDPAPPGRDPDPLLALLETGVRQVDDLTRDSGLPPAQVAARLLELELAGRVQSLPGGAWTRRR